MYIYIVRGILLSISFGMEVRMKVTYQLGAGNCVKSVSHRSFLLVSAIYANLYNGFKSL